MSEEGLYQHMSAKQVEEKDLPSALDVLRQERNKTMSEDKPFKIYDFKMYNTAMAARVAPLAYLIALEEAREQQERAEDFVRRYPHGLDLYGVPELPQRKPLTHVIIQWVDLFQKVREMEHDQR